MGILTKLNSGRCAVNNTLSRIFRKYSPWRIRWIIPVLSTFLIISTALCIWLASYAIIVILERKTTEVKQKIVVDEFKYRIEKLLERGVAFHATAHGMVRNFLQSTNSTFSQRMCDDMVSLWMCMLKEGKIGMLEIAYGDKSSGQLCRLQRMGNDEYIKFFSVNNTLQAANVDPVYMVSLRDASTYVDYYNLEDREWFKIGLQAEKPKMLNYIQEEDLPPIARQIVVSNLIINKELLGTVSISWAPDTIGTFLKESQFDKKPNGSRIFLLDPQWYLFDASDGYIYDSIQNPVSVFDNDVDELIRAGAKQLNESLQSSNPPEYLEFEHEEEVYNLYYRPFALGQLELHLGCIVRKTSLGTISTSLQYSLVVTTLIMIIAVILSCLVTTLCISSPINRTTKDMRQISRFKMLSKDVKNPILFELRQMSKAINSLKRGIKNFKLYVPGFVVDVILKDEKKSQLGLKLHRMTVVFTEISNFSFISQQMRAEELVVMLNEFFSEVSESVVKHGGWINIFLGDTMFCSFGLQKLKAHEFAAVESSLEMDRRITTLQERWAESGYPKVTVHQGINTGLIWVGNIGNSDFRMQWTCLGDAVNTAARIQQIGNSLCEDSNCIIIGEATQSCVGHLIYSQWIGMYQLRGRQQYTNLYRIIAGKVFNGVSPFWATLLEESLSIKNDIERQNYDKALKTCEKIRMKYSNYPSLLQPMIHIEAIIKERIQTQEGNTELTELT